MVSTLQRDGAGNGLRLHRAGVVTCVVVEVSDPECGLGEMAEDTFVRAGAAMVLPAGIGVVGAFRRVTDAVRATMILRTHLPSSRIALSAGETGSHGEFSSIADKATRLVADADAGSTLLSKLAGVLAMDHLPRDRTLHERCGSGVSELSYELLAAPFSSPA
ncbi:MAG: hypothetical protein QOI95_2160 [Acidimicrobiaceae bacterium]|jgi:hypothetical protein